MWWLAAELLTSVVYQQYMPTEIQPRYKTSMFAQGIEWTGDRLRSRANAVVNGSQSPVHLSMARKRHLHQPQGVDGGFCFSTDVIRIFCFKSVWHLWIIFLSTDLRQMLYRCFLFKICLKSVDFLFFSGCQTNPLLSTPLHSPPEEGWWPRGEDGERRNSSGGNREQNPLCIPFRLNKTQHGCSLHHCRRR